jgi:hypothetical protein
VISSASIIDSDRASPRYSSVPSVEAWDRDEIAAAGMGAPAAVARGSHEEPQLIVLRYEPPDAAGPARDLVSSAEKRPRVRDIVKQVSRRVAASTYISPGAGLGRLLSLRER